MVSTVQQLSSTDTDSLLRCMLDKIVAFQALLLEEQEAIRSLSFGQFTSVTTRKAHLLDDMRILEQQRRSRPSAAEPPSAPVMRLETELTAAIGQTDRLNRVNAALIGQSLEFLQGALRLWQRSPESTALYSSSGAAIAQTRGMVRAKG